MKSLISNYCFMGSALVASKFADVLNNTLRIILWIWSFSLPINKRGCFEGISLLPISLHSSVRLGSNRLMTCDGVYRD